MRLARRALLGGFAATGAGGFATAGYATVVEPWLRLRVAEYRIVPAGWPAGLRLTVAALADLHMGEPQMSLARVEEIVGATNALRPDLVLLLGDYAISRRLVTRHVAPAEGARVLAGLRAPLGVHAVLGNHDWWEDPEAMRDRRGPPAWGRALMGAGLPVLENAAVRLRKDGQALWLLGLGDHWAFRRSAPGRPRGRDDLPAALAAVTDDAPVLLAVHVPDVFATVPARVALTFAGHTHGGQVNILGWSPMVPSIYGNRYRYGHVVEDGRHLVVSGGLGTTALPVRFGVPPEITLVHLG